MQTLVQMENFCYKAESVNLDWPIYKQRLQNFFTINNIGFKVIAPDATAHPPVFGETTSLALNYLIHVGGPKILDIYNATESTVTPLTYVTFVATLDARFTVVNSRISDFQFRSCVQLEDEKLADYANRLRVLARSAGIADLALDTNILSVILYTTRDSETRMKCLDEATTLESLLSWRKAHDVKHACSAAMESKHNIDICHINSEKHSKRTPMAQGAVPRSAQSTRKCFLCGYDYPHKDECPAKGKKCNKCGKLNHFESVCQNGRRNGQTNHNYSSRLNLTRLRQINQDGDSHASSNSSSSRCSARRIEDLDENELIEEFESFYKAKQLSSTFDNSSLRQITITPMPANLELINELSDSQLLACPRTYLLINKSKVRHLVDTGTNVNIIASDTYYSLKLRPALQPSQVHAYGFNSKTKIPLLGEFHTTIRFRHRSVRAKYLVLDGKADDIIGYSTASALGIIKIECDNNPELVNTINSTHANYENTAKDPRISHPQLFEGNVGLLKNFEVTLETDPLVRPVQQPAYPVPFALMELTKKKLDFLEEQKIISKANGEKLTWISPCHPVAKMNDKGELTDVRITCNAKQLNKALIQQKRHIPSVPELTNELAGCEWFSIMDFKDAFNQMLFEASSRPLAAMSTIWGVYIWNRLNMGISIASELFQEIMEKVLEGIPQIKIALDDVMAHTKTLEQHETILQQCLDRIAESGMTLNPNKCKFYRNEVDFWGVTISKNGICPKKSKK